jgi:hypothetical protein
VLDKVTKIKEKIDFSSIIKYKETRIASRDPLDSFDFPCDDGHVERHAGEFYPKEGMVLSRYFGQMREGIKITFGSELRHLHAAFVQAAAKQDALGRTNTAMTLVNWIIVDPALDPKTTDEAVKRKAGVCVEKSLAFSLLMNYDHGDFKPNFSVMGGLTLAWKKEGRDLAAHEWSAGKINEVRCFVDVAAERIGIPVIVSDDPSHFRVFASETMAAALGCHQKIAHKLEGMFARDNARMEKAQDRLRELERGSKPVREMERDELLNVDYSIRECHNRMLVNYLKLLRDKGAAFDREYFPKTQVAVVPVENSGEAKAKTRV